MKEFTIIKGGDQERLAFNCQLDDDGSLFIEKAFLYIFGHTQRIAIHDEGMLKKVKAFCLAEYTRQQKYRRIEKAFKERLGETIDIDNEESYNIATYEWMKKTGDDNNMNDLNGDLKAF